MQTIDGVVDQILGSRFEIECFKIEIRGKDHEEIYFSGPGSITGGTDGTFSFRLYNTLEKEPQELIRLSHVAADRSELMGFSAESFTGVYWTGTWFVPRIDISDGDKCIITGEMTQLTTRMPLTAFDHLWNTTVNYYFGLMSLPMLSTIRIQRIRDGEVEGESAHRDLCELSHKGANIAIALDEEKKRTTVSSTYRDGLGPPICEIGLADAFAFATASSFRPRITIRYFEKDALLFVRHTHKDPRSGMPRAVARSSGNANAFWNVFLSFLSQYEQQQDYDSVPLSKTFSELVLASTGSVHGFILALVVTIEEVVKQIVGEYHTKTASFAELVDWIKCWKGDDDVRESAIKLISSNLGRPSTPQHLKQLASQGVITEDQIKIWKDLRPKIAHGKTIDYTDQQLFTKHNHLITMFYRLTLRLLKYEGPMTDYTLSPPANIDFQWKH